MLDEIAASRWCTALARRENSCASMGIDEQELRRRLAPGRRLSVAILNGMNQPREVEFVARQRGSHVRMKHPDRRVSLTVSLHRELKRGTLSGILGDAGLDSDRLRQLL
jgi:hypothetical protein